MKVMKRDATLEEKTSSERIKYLIDTYCDGSQNEFVSTLVEKVDTKCAKIDTD